MTRDLEYELHCPQCGAVDRCFRPRMIARLRSIGKLRRESEPDAALLVELFRNAAAAMNCESCQHVGLSAQPAPATDWLETRRCERCGQTIPQERLEIFPQAVRCVACESRLDSGDPSEREFCPRCGEVMSVRLSRHSGLSRYELRCPRCRA